MKQRSMFGKIKYRGTRGRQGLAAWEKRSYPVSIRHTHDLPDVPGFVETECAGLGINKSNQKNPKGKYDWVVTHLPSGMMLMTTATKGNAQKMLMALCESARAQGFTWNAEGDSLRTSAVYDVVVAARNRYGVRGR